MCTLNGVGDDSDGGSPRDSIVDSEWCLNPRVLVVVCSWLVKLTVVSFVVDSVI